MLSDWGRTAPRPWKRGAEHRQVDGQSPVAETFGRVGYGLLDTQRLRAVGPWGPSLQMNGAARLGGLGNGGPDAYAEAGGGIQEFRVAGARSPSVRASGLQTRAVTQSHTELGCGVPAAPCPGDPDGAARPLARGAGGGRLP